MNFFIEIKSYPYREKPYQKSEITLSNLSIGITIKKIGYFEICLLETCYSFDAFLFTTNFVKLMELLDGMLMHIHMYICIVNIMPYKPIII